MNFINLAQARAYKYFRLQKKNKYIFFFFKINLFLHIVSYKKLKVLLIKIGKFFNIHLLTYIPFIVYLIIPLKQN